MSETYSVALAVYATPALPLGVSWWNWARSRGAVLSRDHVSLSFATGSLVWLLLGSLFPKLWGPYYSTFRSMVIDGNFLGMLVAAAASEWSKERFWTGAGSLSLALIWAFIAAINSVV